VEVAEFEALLADVEVRVDRLKSLYEQWFQGIERLEPTIPRKDVERKLVLMRKELPRNTMLRFRFQQLVQRWTTMTTYWGRVARQIEEGTYRRDVLKARRARQEARTAQATSAFALDLEVDVSLDEGFEDEAAPAQAGTETPAVPAMAKAGATAAAPARPGAAKTAGGVAAGATATPARPVVPPPPRPIAPIAPIPPGPGAPGPSAAAPRAFSPFALAAARKPVAAPAPGATATSGPDAPRPPAQAAQPQAQTPARAAQPQTQVAQASARAAQPRPIQTFGRPQGAPPPGAAPTPARAPAPNPALVPTRPAAPAASTTSGGAGAGLGDAELRGVYDRYIEARRKNNESTNISFDAVARNLREMAPKMQQKYGKPVDFEVVVKDGRVGFKPVPRG
jgi:hypothetical protein